MWFLQNCYNRAVEDSIFTKIIKGEIPCHKVYEDNMTMAIMDIHPIQPGHVLVFTKIQVEDFFDLPDEDYQAFAETIKKVAARLKEVFPDKRRIGVQIEGLDVPHVHAKVFPINSAADFHNIPDQTTGPNHAILADLAKKLAF